MKRPNARRLLESLRSARQEVQAQCKQVTKAAAQEPVNENLHKWFKEKWVRFGPDGKIRGDCARGSDSEGKPKCLPQSKAHALGKKVVPVPQPKNAVKIPIPNAVVQPSMWLPKRKPLNQCWMKSVGTHIVKQA